MNNRADPHWAEAWRWMQVWSLLGTIAICVWLGWGMFWPHATFCKQPVSLEEFTDQLGIKPPPSATNLFFAKSSVGIAGRASLYRFDAAVGDCLSYAQELIALGQKEADPMHQATNGLQALTNRPAPIDLRFLRHYGLSAIRWFDIESIRTGYTGFAPPALMAESWVDAERGRFYYYWTD